MNDSSTGEAAERDAVAARRRELIDELTGKRSDTGAYLSSADNEDQREETGWLLPFAHEGELVRISDPLVEEVGQVIGAHMSMHDGISSQRMEVQLAHGAAEGLGL